MMQITIGVYLGFDCDSTRQNLTFTLHRGWLTLLPLISSALLLLSGRLVLRCGTSVTAGDCSSQSWHLQGRQASHHSAATRAKSPGQVGRMRTECRMPCHQAPADPSIKGEFCISQAFLHQNICTSRLLHSQKSRSRENV